MKKRAAKKEQNLRRYSRVNTYLPMAAFRVGAATADELFSRVERDAIIVDFTAPPVLDNANLSEILSRLDSKLSAILSLLVPERRGFTALSFRVLNLSANGLRFQSPETFADGDLLELKLVLYGRPHILMTLYGEVLRCLEHSDGYVVAIRFVSETEEVREAFLNYDFAGHKAVVRRLIADGGRDANLLLVNR